jgi:ATP-dependent HslUV protease, peptidase subunit HslV
MSIAVVVKKGKEIAVGADSQFSFGSSITCEGNIVESKIRKIGNTCLVSTGWGIYDDIFNDYLSRKKNIKLNTRLQIFKFFNNFWQDLHNKYSFVNDQCDDDESPFGELDASFLIATSKRIFYVSSNMTVTEFLKFQAIGSGSEYAIGAMHVLYEQDFSAAQIARKGLETAIAHNVYCGGNTEVITI